MADNTDIFGFGLGVGLLIGLMLGALGVGGLIWAIAKVSH